MSKKIFWLGISITALIFGTVITGCVSASSANTNTTVAETQTDSVSPTPSVTPAETTTPVIAFEGFWTRFDLSETDADAPEDWQILNSGSLIIIRNGSTSHSWKQEGNTIVITLNDGYATLNLQIVNNNLLRGTATNRNNLTWPVELRKIQNPVTIKSTEGSLAVLGVNGYFILDSATRLYLNLTEEQEDEFFFTYMVKDGELNYLSMDEHEVLYNDLFRYYQGDKALWGFDIAAKTGSIYSVVFRRDGKRYHGIVSNMSFAEGETPFVFPLED